LRIDSLLGGVRASLGSINDVMQHHIPAGNITEEEYKRFVNYIGKSILETIHFSDELYKMFPDIRPDELKADWGKN
jgi:hypothetical protein